MRAATRSAEREAHRCTWRGPWLGRSRRWPAREDARQKQRHGVGELEVRFACRAAGPHAAAGLPTVSARASQHEPAGHSVRPCAPRPRLWMRTCAVWPKRHSSPARLCVLPAGCTARPRGTPPHLVVDEADVAHALELQAVPRRHARGRLRQEWQQERDYSHDEDGTREARQRASSSAALRHS